MGGRDVYWLGAGTSLICGLIVDRFVRWQME